ELHIAPEAGALVQSFAIADRLEARQYEALEQFDRDTLWQNAAATSLQAWLRDHAGRSQADAARIARTVQRLRDLPALAAAWRDGRMSSERVHAVAALITDPVAPLFAEHETDNVTVLELLDGHDVARWLRQ